MSPRTVILALLAVACSAPAPAAPAARTPLPTIGLELELPPGFVATPRAHGEIEVAVPNVRVQRSLLISTMPAIVAPGARTFAAGAGTVIATITDTDGGSGGAEQFLDGRFDLAGRTWRVRCVDQVEHVDPDATWCVAVLATATILAPPHE